MRSFSAVDTPPAALDYFDSLTRFAVPMDERAIAALAGWAMALDMYCWLAQRQLHRVPAGHGNSFPGLLCRNSSVSTMSASAIFGAIS